METKKAKFEHFVSKAHAQIADTDSAVLGLSIGTPYMLQRQASCCIEKQKKIYSFQRTNGSTM